jgi:predicted NUDIX family NTP pyrophosphohydrolase
MEWPPGSGRQQKFPEVDRAEWFELAEATERINKGQRGFLEQLRTLLISDDPHRQPTEPER